jgi:hypothetical protein
VERCSTQRLDYHIRWWISQDEKKYLNVDINVATLSFSVSAQAATSLPNVAVSADFPNAIAGCKYCPLFCRGPVLDSLYYACSHERTFFSGVLIWYSPQCVLHFPLLVTPGLISGEANDLKVTFRNTGKTDLKVNLIVGSVAEMTDFNNVIRNVSKGRGRTGRR